MSANRSHTIDTDAIRQSNNLADAIARELGHPLRRGATLVWNCPFHADNDPSFHVYPDGQFHCFGCGKHGDIITWTMERGGLTFLEACRALDPTSVTSRRSRAEQGSYNPDKRERDRSLPQAHLPPEAPPDNWQGKAFDVLVKCEVQLWQDDTLPSGKVRNYLAARGLETEILREYMVGYNPKEVRFDEIKLRIPPGIVIPYWHPALNTLYGVNVRVDQDTLARGRSQTNGMAKYMLASGSKRAPFGIENIAGKRYAFVCEGELDTLLLIQTLRTMGPEAKHIGAFTMGSASSQDPERWLLVYPELLDPVRYLIATDRDEAGQKAAQRWLESTGRARSFPPPSPCKDITELWEKHGYEGVRWWVRAALERFDHQGSQMANS